MQGVIHKHEYTGTLVTVRDTMAFLPKSLSIPGEKYIAGRPIRALLKTVHKEYRSSGQLILDRSSSRIFSASIRI